MSAARTDFTGITGDAGSADSTYMEQVAAAAEVPIKALYTITETAELMGRPQQTVWDWVKDGTLKSVKIGKGRGGRFVTILALRAHGEIWESIRLAYSLRSLRAA